MSRVKTIVTDFLDYQTNDRYDNIISNFTIHFVGSDNIKPFLEKMTELTKPGGINVIDDFTNNGPIAKKHPESYINYDILSDFYLSKGWRILYTSTRNVPLKSFEYSSEPVYSQATAFIAQKSK